MSLVNDMLNDLDDRRLERVGEDVNLDWMSGQKVTRKKTPLLSLSIAISIGLLIFVAYELWQLNNSQQVSVLDYLVTSDSAEQQTQPAGGALSQQNEPSEDSITASVQTGQERVNVTVVSDTKPKVLAESKSEESEPDVVPIETVIADVESKAITRVEELQDEDSIERSVVSKTQALFSTAVENKSSGAPKVVKSAGVSTLEQKDTQLSRRADELIRAGRVCDAEDQLQSFVNQNPGAVKSGKKLVSLWLSTQKYTKADQLIAKLRGIRPDDVGLITRQARLYLLTDRLSSSVDLLMDHKPSLKEHPDYYELLGLASRQNNQYTLSAQAYRGLLEFNPGRGDWWVGMAIALDLQGEYKQARAAYQQGIGSRGLTMPLRDYAKQRLSVL